MISKHMRDIQCYGLMNFLAERQVPGLNEDIMFICKESIEWHNQIIEQGHSDSASLHGELTALRMTMQKDLRCMDVQLLKEDNQTLEDTVEMINQFSSHIKQIKVEKSLAMGDFTRISKVESMLTISLDHLDSHRDKVQMVKRKKEIWKQRVIHISFPHVTVIEEFLKVHREWSTTKAVMVSVQNTNPSVHTEMEQTT